LKRIFDVYILYYIEHESVDGVVESLKIVTEERSMKIAEFAFARVSKVLVLDQIKFHS